MVYFQILKELGIDTVPDDPVTRTLFRIVADDRLRRQRLIERIRTATETAKPAATARRKWQLCSNLLFFADAGRVQ